MTMTFSEYRGLAMRTAASTTFSSTSLLVYSLGLVNETIEVEEALEGFLSFERRFGPVPRASAHRSKLIKELGDVTWYVAALLTILIDGFPSMERTGKVFTSIDDPDTRTLLSAEGHLRRARLTAKDVGEMSKKAVGHGHAIVVADYEEKLAIMLGRIQDVAAVVLETPLDEVFEANIAKLKARYGEKFSEEASINRMVEEEK